MPTADTPLRGVGQPTHRPYRKGDETANVTSPKAKTNAVTPIWLA